MDWRQTVILIVLVSLGTALGVSVVLPGKERDKREAAAEEAVCRDMAADVLAGTATRFDYMTTRCPARFLVDSDKAK